MHNVFNWTGPPFTLATVLATNGDIMSYCRPQWASTYTYNGVLFGRGPGILTATGGVATTLGVGANEGSGAVRETSIGAARLSNL